MDLPLLARAPTSPRRTTAEREPGRRTEGAPVYKQPASGNRLLKGGRHDRRTANRRGAGKGVAYLARNWKFESISLQRRVRNEPCAAGEARMPAKAHGFARSSAALAGSRHSSPRRTA